MKILHIIDASNHVYRGASIKRPYYYGQEMVSGVLTPKSILHGGFTTLMNYVPSMEKEYFYDPEIENVYAFCFDSRSLTYKKQKYPFYKANRKYDPEIKAHAQMEYAEEVLKSYGYVVCREEGYEGDDVAYSLWQKCHDDYDLIVLHSTDKDWAFMIDDKTIQMSKRKLPSGKYEYVVIESTNYERIYKVQYNLMLLYKVLKGDSSDGVSGIGVKFMSEIRNTLDAGYPVKQLGSIRNVRDILLQTGNKHPHFPIEQAIRVLDIISPESVDVSEYAFQLADSRPKKLPYNYITSVRPQSRDDEHREMFYDFVETARKDR